jgi:hypothetical protein
MHGRTWKKWAGQRDRGIWDGLLIELAHWKGRVTLEWVEAHVDTKKVADGNKRTPSSKERMNIVADEVADLGYANATTALNLKHTSRSDTWGVYTTKGSHSIVTLTVNRLSRYHTYSLEYRAESFRF